MINSLTSLRGVFILFIVFHHLHLYPGGGTMPVTFFFVLGGFSLTLGYKDKVLKQDFSYKQYIIWRCIKFFPLHWMCLLAAIPLVFLSYNKIKVLTFIINAALLQTWIPVKSIYFSFNYVSWYLADTMFFAVVFPLLLKLIVHATFKMWACFIAFFSIIYVLIAILIPTDMYHAILYVSPYIRLADFVFGIFLALIYSRLKRYPMNCLYSQIIILSIVLLLVIESLLLPISVQMIAPIYWPLVAILLLTASIYREGNLLENKYLVRIGECSFIIFLTHQLVLRYISFFFEYLHCENYILYVVVSLNFIFVVSFFVEHYIIKTITQWLKEKIHPYMIAR